MVTGVAGLLFLIPVLLIGGPLVLALLLASAAKSTSGAVVSAGLGIACTVCVWWWMFGPTPERQAREREQDAYRLAQAQQAERLRQDCTTSGLTVARRTHDVDGVVWMRWPEEARDEQGKTVPDFRGRDCVGESCIRDLLRATSGLELDPGRELRYHKGFAFVESIDPADGRMYRYRLQLYRAADRDPTVAQRAYHSIDLDILAELSKEEIDQPSAQYGIGWDEAIRPEDAPHRIVRSSLAIVDLDSKEMLAGRVRYFIKDYIETACPAFPPAGPSNPIPTRTQIETRDFAISILNAVEVPQ